jgi:outer membrane protein OmpA-like peptidoglycan-associated protein
MMRFLFVFLLINLCSAVMVQAAPNCQHSNSWQCNHQAGNSAQQSQTSAGIGSAGNTPNTGSTNTPLGTVTPTQPPIQVNPLPPQVISGYGAVPKPQPVAVPPKPSVNAPPQNVYPIPPKVITGYGAVPQPQPMAVPSKPTVNAPPQHVYPIPPRVITGYGAVPQPQPMAVPPKSTVNVPPQNVYPIPPLVITGTSAVPPKQKPTTPAQPVNMVPSPTGGSQSPRPTVPTPGTQTPQPTAIITHVDSSNLHPEVLLRQQTLHSGYKFEEIEPMIKNTQVDVYRGKDASRMLYQDTLPMDRRGFHLTVLGIKEPTFVDTSVSDEPEELRSFTFYFDFASAEIKPKQQILFSEIIDEHQKTGKKIIIVGETDDFGTEEYNRHLAVHRSTKIINELKSRGVTDDEIELRVLVRCCRTDHPTKETLAQTRDQRITWVHFE